MSAAVLSLSITDPQKQGDGINAFVSYKVTATLSRRLEGLDALTYAVIRRYSDFVWLRSALREEHPALLVPPLPEKQAIGRLNTDFVEIRHRALQRFAVRLCAHPALSQSEAVKRFISLSPEAFATLRDAKNSKMAMVGSAAAAAGSGVMRFMKSAAGAIKGVASRGRSDSGAAPAGADGGAAASGTPSGGAAGGAAGSSLAADGSSPTGATHGRSAEDLSFAELEGYILNQAPIVTALYNAAAQQAIKHRQQAQLTLEYGASLKALGVTEGGAVGNALAQAGVSAWAESTACYEQAVIESELFVERVADVVRGIRAVKELLGERSKSSAHLSDTLAVVEGLRAKLTALASNPAANAASERARLEQELTAAQANVTTARQAYDKVAASVIGELERYRGEGPGGLKGEFRGMLLDLVSSYARTSSKIAASWEAIAAQLSAAVTAEGATPLPVNVASPSAAAPMAAGSGAAGAASFPSVF